MKKFIITLVALIGMITSINADPHTYYANFQDFEGISSGMARVSDHIMIRALNGYIQNGFYYGHIQIQTTDGDYIKEVRITNMQGGDFTGVWGDFSNKGDEAVSTHGGYYLDGHISMHSAGLIIVTTK